MDTPSPTPTLDDQLAAACAAIMEAETFAERNRAGQTFMRLQAIKLRQAHAAADAATLAQRQQSAATHNAAVARSDEAARVAADSLLGALNPSN